MTGIARPERDSDISAIREVHQAAFGRAAEARLVDALRANGKLLISLLMDCEGMIVGHIAFSPVKVEEWILVLASPRSACCPAFRGREWEVVWSTKVWRSAGAGALA